MSYSVVQKHPRYWVQVPVTLVLPSFRILQLTTENVSLGGLFIRMDEPIEKDTPVRVKMGTAYGAVVADARVMHAMHGELAERKKHPTGVGIQFAPMEPDSQVALERYVQFLVDEIEDTPFAEGSPMAAQLLAVLRVAGAGRRTRLEDARPLLLCARELGADPAAVRKCVEIIDAAVRKHEETNAAGAGTVVVDDVFGADES